MARLDTGGADRWDTGAAHRTRAVPEERTQVGLKDSTHTPDNNGSDDDGDGGW